MATKKISLTNEERIALQTMVSMEIKQNHEAEKVGIEPAWSTKKLKALYEKIAEYEWKDLG